MFDYLEEAKKAHVGFCDTQDKSYGNYAQTTALIAIAEQIKRIANALEIQGNLEEFFPPKYDDFGRDIK